MSILYPLSRWDHVKTGQYWVDAWEIKKILEQLKDGTEVIVELLYFTHVFFIPTVMIECKFIRRLDRMVILKITNDERRAFLKRTIDTR